MSAQYSLKKLWTQIDRSSRQCPGKWRDRATELVWKLSMAHAELERRKAKP